LSAKRSGGGGRSLWTHLDNPQRRSLANGRSLQRTTLRQKSLPCANRTGTPHFSSTGVISMSDVVVSQERLCKSDCEQKLCPRLYLCLHCRQQVLVCRRCDRGQVYCGYDCSQEVRRSRQRGARSRYQASERGRQLHAERSRRYRARGRSEHRVTDQGQNLAPKPAQQPEPARAIAPKADPSAINTRRRLSICNHCGRPVSDFLRLDPVRRPSRRRIARLAGRPAPRHRQKTTDLHRR